MLRDKGRAHKTIALHVAAILHFFVELNDVSLNKRKITRFIPPDESDHKDKPYRVEDIRAILQLCDDARTRVIVLLMASTACRIGAIPYKPYRRISHFFAFSSKEFCVFPSSLILKPRQYLQLILFCKRRLKA